MISNVMISRRGSCGKDLSRVPNVKNIKNLANPLRRVRNYSL